MGLESKLTMEQSPEQLLEDSRPDAFDRARIFLQDYAWFIVRNIIGWVLILCSPMLGAFVPGPGGLPVFLIGFALVTFPGKRKLTARVLRGRRLHIEDKWYLYIAAFISIAIPGAVGWIAWKQYEENIKHFIAEIAPERSFYVLLIILAVSLTWLMTRLSLKMLNGLLRLLPRIRRKFRPWMKRRGLHLLPPRRKSSEEPPPQDEILELAAHHQHRFREIWRIGNPW